MAGNEVTHLALTLPWAVNRQEPRLEQNRALPLSNALPKYHLNGPGLVFQRDEDDPVGGHGLLANGDDAAAANEAPIGHLVQLSRGLKPPPGQLWPQKSERMMASPP